MDLYDKEILHQYCEDNPEASSGEILAFLEGIQVMLARLQTLAANNQIIIIPKDADNKTLTAKNILQFPIKDKD